jgi:hypothetical protein
MASGAVADFQANKPLGFVQERFTEKKSTTAP